ncbi:MAG TPA: OmpA family protein, partial [Rhizomicrobium sp.]
LGLSGCGGAFEDFTPFNGARDAIRGAPRINDNVFMMRNGGEEDAYSEIPSVIPNACLPSEATIAAAMNNVPDKPKGGRRYTQTERGTLEDEARNLAMEKYMNEMDSAAVARCTDAMKLLIDTRFVRFRHVLSASISTTNFFVDAIFTGLTTSIPLVAPGTKNVLGAIAAGLSGTRRNFDENILYSYSIQTILQQMETDRLTKAREIDKRLTSRPYRNMFEAASDLFEYDQAGSWDHAMGSLQTSVAAQTAACAARLRNQKLDEGTTPDPLPNGRPFPARQLSSALNPCPAEVPTDADGGAGRSTAAPHTDEEIVFKGGSTPNAAAVAALAQKILAGLADGSVQSVTVQGQADSTGDADENKKLATERADAVKKKLHDLNVPDAKVTDADPAIKLNAKRIVAVSLIGPAPAPIKPAKTDKTVTGPPVVGTEALVKDAVFILNDGTVIKVVDGYNPAAGTVSYVAANSAGDFPAADTGPKSENAMDLLGRIKARPPKPPST